MKAECVRRLSTRPGPTQRCREGLHDLDGHGTGRGGVQLRDLRPDGGVCADQRGLLHLGSTSATKLPQQLEGSYMDLYCDFVVLVEVESTVCLIAVP